MNEDRKNCLKIIKCVIGFCQAFLFIVTMSYFYGCYSIPKDSRDFLEEYNRRNPADPVPEDLGEPLEGFQTYQEQILSYEDWKKSNHYQDIMKRGGQRAKDIIFILNNIPGDNVIFDNEGDVVLTFSGFVEISPIGSIVFSVIYPGTNQKDSLSFIDTLGLLQGNAVNKKL